MGEAKRRGTFEQRAAEATERQRLQKIEAAKRRVLIAKQHRTRQILIVKERIESRHITRSEQRYLPGRPNQRRGKSLLMPMILPMMLTMGIDKPYPCIDPRRKI